MLINTTNVYEEKPSKIYIFFLFFPLKLTVCSEFVCYEGVAFEVHKMGKMPIKKEEEEK